MNNKKLLINNVEVDVQQLMFSNSGSPYSDEIQETNNYFPEKLNNITLVPLYLLAAMFSIDKNHNRFNTAYIDDCSLLEITEKYPGVQIAFFRPDSFRRCYFDFYNAQEININTNSGNEIIIRVIF